MIIVVKSGCLTNPSPMPDSYEQVTVSQVAPLLAADQTAFRAAQLF